jgi:hypothetical protein
MTPDALLVRLHEAAREALPLPASGHTPERFDRLVEFGKEDLSLARLAEAHFDAVAILAEAGHGPRIGAIYGVWASEIPGNALTLSESKDGFLISGTKRFCSGAGVIDHALVTVAAPDPYLVEVDLRLYPENLEIETGVWKASAFALTNTTNIRFNRYPVSKSGVLCGRGWYLSRPGFWHGAIGPACCWAGGADALLAYARRQSRSDAHTLAHLGAMHALQWAMQSCLATAGREIDASPADLRAAHLRALTVRHLVEQGSTEIVRRFARAYGPYPLAFDEQISRQYQELDIYLRQCHAERDLECLGKDVSARSRNVE